MLQNNVTANMFLFVADLKRHDLNICLRVLFTKPHLVQTRKDSFVVLVSVLESEEQNFFDLRRKRGENNQKSDK